MNSWNKSIFSWVKKWKRTPSPTLFQTWFSWSCGRFTATFWKVRLTMLGRSWNVSFWWEEVELWQEELSRLINGTWNQWKLIKSRKNQCGWGENTNYHEQKLTNLYWSWKDHEQKWKYNKLFFYISEDLKFVAFSDMCKQDNRKIFKQSNPKVFQFEFCTCSSMHILE